MKKIAYMLVALSVSCQATVMPQHSRVIFHPGEVKRSLLLVNNEDAPVLVQSWVDLGRPDKKPGEKNFPFVALPAVFRLNKAEKRVITLIRSAQSASLPADRESLYWLNIYEISAVKKNIAQQKLNKFNLAMNTQLKIINRPFRDSYNFRERTQKLKFQTQQMAGKIMLTVINPTPYYFTPGQMNITIGSWQNKVYLGADKAVAPFSDKAFPLTIHSGVLPAGKATLHFSAIDDDGALQYFTYDLNRQKSLRFSG
ncbi:molecular chaperone [Escherichia coli]|nr:molecular chaperone [Escherichia coli]